MLKSILLILPLVFSAPMVAMAEGETSERNALKIEEVTEQRNKVPGDIDSDILNAKLRADSGSKSKFSLSATALYSGGTVSSPFGSERPNIKGTPDRQTLSSLGGGLNGRYRWTKNESVTAGTTYGIMTPFQGQVSDGTQQFNIFDPNIAYNRVGTLGSMQTTLAVTYAYGTSNESINIDQTNQYSASMNTMYAFQNKVSLGSGMSLNYNDFTSSPGKNKTALKKGFYGNDTRVAWQVNIFPQAEYRFNSTFSARTLFGYFNWKHLYGDPNSGRLLQTYVYQSIGIGISVTRDIYLYPNVQFLPDNFRSQYTNASMAATLNLF